MKRLSTLVLGAVLPLLTAAAGDLRLVGTMMMDSGAGDPSHAVFETDDKRQLIVDLGQEIEGCVLVDVGARQVRMDCAAGEVSLVLRSKLRAARQDPPSAPRTLRHQSASGRLRTRGRRPAASGQPDLSGAISP